MQRILLVVIFFIGMVGCGDDGIAPVFDCTTSDLSSTETVTGTACGTANGSVTINVSGGLAPYAINLNGVLQSGTTINGLEAGIYNIMIEDARECSLQKQFSISNLNGVNASVNLTETGCGTSQGQIEVLAVEGVAPYAYMLDMGADQSENIFEQLPAGQYQITVKDANGCEFNLDALLASGVSYKDQVGPIIMNSCSVIGCHDGSSAQPDFRTLATVQSLSAGIKSRTQSGNMPKTGALTQEEIDLIACWVDDGALDN
jgi:hypothetical protein